MNRREIVAGVLAECVARLDPVLNPWGFTFEPSEIAPSHQGPFASGHYCRGSTRIGVSCHDEFDNVYYSHSVVTESACCREIEKFGIGHAALMSALGHADDCWLVTGDDPPNYVVARDGGDALQAWIHDLQIIAASVLRDPSDKLLAIMRPGGRSYSVEWGDSATGQSG